MFQFEFQKRRFAFYEAASTFDLCEPCALRAERVGGPYAVRRKRVVIIEYAWITGATAISAVGQILELGASSVVLLPVARVIDSNWWDKEHPYLQAMRRPLREHWLAIDWPR